jgi:hypothetical protein
MRMLIYWARNAGVKFAWAEIGLVKGPFSIRAKVSRRQTVDRVPNSFAGLGLEVSAEALLRVADSYAARFAIINPPNLWRICCRRRRALTPVSGHDGKVVATNILEGNRLKPDYRGVPSVAFTVPPIASVGLKESQAQQQGLKFKVKSENTPNWYTARRLAERVYGYKTLVEEGTGQILGAHIVGPHADEVINLFGLAIRHNLTARDLQTTMFAYPTGASDIGYMV